MHDGCADPPSEASAVQVLFKKMEASVKWSLFYPPLRQFQDIDDLLIASTDIQYSKTDWEHIGYQIWPVCVFAHKHISEQDGHLGLAYLIDYGSRWYSAKLLKYQY